MKLSLLNFQFVIVDLVQINTTADAKETTNPFRFSNIGVEKFLELNSEQNHDDYCLAYLFTDRDFDDGVLGLAWVGAPSGPYHSQKLFLVFSPVKFINIFLFISVMCCFYMFICSTLVRNSFILRTVVFHRTCGCLRCLRFFLL